MDVIPNRINSDLGAELASALRKSSIQEVAAWCRKASAILCDHGRTDAEKSDMALFMDAATTLDALAERAA